MWAFIRDLAKKSKKGNAEEMYQALDKIEDIATGKSQQNVNRQYKHQEKKKNEQKEEESE